ncbi:MAG TPA: CHAT domain-containing tetratricopeptide repeat protein [Pyrinomonadaceae bacterium]|nr:CHAT domain-containing tetratricopeptide repeat protein [Pyrinomonadaceae bacterium]
MPPHPLDADASRRLRLALLLCLIPCVASARAQTGAPAPKDLGPLAPGLTTRQEMEGGDVHTFRVPLKPGQYFRAVVEQEDIDVVVSFFEPGAPQSPAVQMDSPNGSRGPESVSIMARTEGDYVLAIRAPERGAMPGRYALTGEGPREPTEADSKRLAAEAAFLEGHRFRRLRTPEGCAQAVGKYTEALRLWQALGDRRQEALTYHSIGLAYRAVPDRAKIREHFDRALAILREENDLYGQAYVNNEIGAALRDFDSARNALPFYQKMYELYERAGSRWGQAHALNNTGIAHAVLGEYAEALVHFRRALPLWQAVRDRTMEGNTHNNIGGMLERLGDPAQAAAHYEEALRLLQETGNPARMAATYTNLGVLRHGFGEMQAASDNYEQALALHREVRNERGQANVLDNIGMVHADWGDAERALVYLDKALTIRKKLGEPRGHAATLDNLGFAYYLLGKYPEARKHFQEAQRLFTQADDRQGVAYTLTHLGMVHMAGGRPQEALGSYAQALDAQKKGGSRLWEAVTLDKIGEAHAATGDLSRAAADYEEALTLWRELRDGVGTARSLYGLARIESARGNLGAARDRIERAINISESLRTRTANHQLRMTYLSTKRDYYELDIDIKMRLHERAPSEGHAEAALESSDRARARGLIDLLAEGQVNVRRGGDPALIAQKGDLEKQLGAVSDRLLLLRGSKVEEKDKARVAAEVANLEREFDALTDSYEDVLTRIRSHSPRYAQLTQPEPLRASKIRELLDDDTLLLEYALGEERSYLWAVTRGGVQGYRLRGRAEIEAAVKSLREDLTAYEPPQPGESSPLDAERLQKSVKLLRQRAAELSEMVLGPVAGRLGVKRVVVVADEALQFVPFEVLPALGAQRPARGAAGRAPLEDGGAYPPPPAREVIYLPSASALALLRATPRGTPDKYVAVFADPVFSSDDARVSTARGAAPAGATRSGELAGALRDMQRTAGMSTLARLPYSLEEANGIISAVPAGLGTVAVGFRANREAATSPTLGGYRAVHFATHALLDDTRPQLSGLVLSLVDEQGRPREGFLRLSDIYNMELPVELVVLSACETGIGKEVRGEGLIGLTRGFMYAGARRVVASLWKVDDEATAALMKSFYRHMFKDRMPPPAALRLAKSELMRSRQQWRAPYFWAGFVLQGDWK